MRTAKIKRETAETKIVLSLDLDGKGEGEIRTGVGFLDHMLELLARHGNLNLSVRCEGDTRVDDHHSTEDVGICLGQAIKKALGDKRGVRRYGQRVLPMDEALILASLDLSGRGGCYYALEIPAEIVGSFDTELVEEFVTALAREAGLTLHLRQFAGKNSHHIIEGAFKACARALREAVSLDESEEDRVPSTKGLLV